MPEIEIDKIKIPDVRVSSVLTEEQKALLASTIKEVGVVQDPVVRDLGDGTFELLAGRSRLQALVDQGAKTVTVKVLTVDEKTGLLMNIIENVARGSYEYISVARAIRKMLKLGSTYEELEKVFPWRARWIEFIEGLQDLPDDVVQAIHDKTITPSHVQIALNLPTPEEIHSGLQTAYRLGWDTGTFKTFVQNRVEEIKRAKAKAAEQGTEPVIPTANPEQLTRYHQCLACGYKKPVEKVTVQMVCEDCMKLIKYITSQVGPPETAIYEVGNALNFYAGVKQEATPPPPPPTAAESPQ
jgi:ParB/RepB/Spo0J family partition protein